MMDVRAECGETKTKEDGTEGDRVELGLIVSRQHLDGDIVGLLDEVLVVGRLVVLETLLEFLNLLRALSVVERVDVIELLVDRAVVGVVL